jgi:hypothetical protein
MAPIQTPKQRSETAGSSSTLLDPTHLCALRRELPQPVGDGRGWRPGLVKPMARVVDLLLVTARDDTQAAHPATGCDRLAKFAARVETPHRVPAHH